MAMEESKMVALGTKAPDFSLKDVVNQKTLSLQDCQGKTGLVVVFMCNHCPFVKHLLGGLMKLANEYRLQGISFVGINANDVQHFPDDSPENMQKLAVEKNFGFPYLFDETQEVAKAYEAACTPDFFVYNHALSLVYRGQFDDSRPGNGKPVTGESLKGVLEALVNNDIVDPNQKPSLGCSIKWK